MKFGNFKCVSFLRNVLLILLLLILLVGVPQINLTGYPQSTLTSKFIVFACFCIGLLCLSVWGILKSKITNLSLSRLDIALVILLVYIVTNRYFFQTDYSFSIRFMELLGLGFLYIVFRTLNARIFYGLLLTIIASGIIQAIYGNLQLLGYCTSNHSGFKLTGSFFNPGPYAGFLVAVFPIALGLYLFREKVVYNLKFDIENKKFPYANNIIKYALEYIPLIAIISIILVIPVTQSRASWLAVVIGSSLLLELRYKILNKLFNQLSKLKKVVLVTILTIIIGISLLGIYHFKKGSSDGRLFIWKVSTEIIKDNPIVGVGFDRFKAHYMNYQADYFASNGETGEALVADNTYYAFNEFMLLVVENGIIGILLLISVLYVIIKLSTKKEHKSLFTIIKVSLLSIGVFAFFSYSMQILPIKLIIVVLLAALSKLCQKKIKPLQNFKISTPTKITLKTLMICGALIMTIFSFKYINKLNTGFKNWQLALSSYQYGDYEGAIQEYESAYPKLKNNGEFLMNYGKALSIYRQDKKAIQILERAKSYLNTTIIETALGDAYKNIKQYNDAEKAYSHAASMIPSRFYPPYLLAKLYDESGQKEKALVMAKTILEKEVKIPSTAIKEIQQEMNNLKIKLKTK